MGVRVAVISSNFWPEQTGTSQVVGEFAAYLAQVGFDVSVVTAMPFYPQWRIWDAYRGRLWRTEQTNGMTVLRSWHLVSPAPSTITRLLHEITLSFFALPNLVRALLGAKRVYIASPALSFAFVGCLVAAVLRVPRCLTVYDVMPDIAIELGMIRSRPVIAVSRWMARCAYALADEIHTLGEGMRRRIAKQATRATIRIVPITIDADELAPVPRSENEFRRRFVKNGTFAVLHTGNIGKKQDLDILLRAAKRLEREPGVHFYVVGDGAEKDRFVSRMAELKLPNMSHHPLQERWLLPHMLSGADVVMVTQAPNVVDEVVPSKLVTALGAGAMVLAAVATESEAADVVRASGGGIIVPPGDEAALANALLAIRRGEIDVAACRRRGRAYALQHYTRSAVYGPLAQAV